MSFTISIILTIIPLVMLLTLPSGLELIFMEGSETYGSQFILGLVIWFFSIPFMIAAGAKATSKTRPIFRGYFYFGIISVVVGVIVVSPTLIDEISGGFSLESTLSSIFLTSYGIGALFCILIGVALIGDTLKKLKEL